MALSLLPRLSWMAASMLGIMGLVSPGGGEVPAFPTAIDLPVTDAAPGDATRLVKARDGLFYVTARVNGAPVRFVVDTGANIVVLTAADARRANVTGARAGSSLRTVGGSSAMRRTTLADMRVAGQRLTATPAAIVDGGMKTSLLGQSALAQFASVTLRGDELELR